VNCETQAAIDEYWDNLSAGGAKQPCDDLFTNSAYPGRSSRLAIAEMLQDDQSEKSERVMKAVLEMEKLDLPTLEKAYTGA
jgi:predicted 3-demethylubiquinone-9 3-methyltransferase (glyoxalase superfamily)